MELKRELGLFTGILVVVASMIGTGIFVTTGEVLGMTYNAQTTLILWAMGGLVAITGALCYAELATIWPDVGGEYVYLKKTFGLLPSFLTGWISLVVAFSASVALSSLTLISYLHQFLKGPEGSGSLLSDVWVQKLAASLVILILGLIHIKGVRFGSFIQNIMTSFKFLIIVSFIVSGFYVADWAFASRLVTDYTSVHQVENIDVSVLGLALLSIMIAFSGWNGATYIAGEIKNPTRNLPKALFYGALLITIIYIAMNALFLLSTPGEKLMGQYAVGAIVNQNLFSKELSQFYTLGIVVILSSSIAVQLMIGPRVYYAMAKDKVIFHSLTRIHPRFKTPALAILIQMAISILYVLIVGQDIVNLLIYMGFALSIFPLLSVIGLIYLRIKQPDLPRPYKVPFFPIVPLIFIILTLGMMIASLIVIEKLAPSLFAVAIVVLGIPIFYLWKHFTKQKEGESSDV